MSNHTPQLDWTDKTTREDDYEEIEFEYVEPMRWLANLWYYDEEDAWFLSITRMDDDEKLHTYAQERNGSVTSEDEAKAWAEREINFKKEALAT